MATNSGEIRWSRRRRAVAVSLVFVAAAVLSAVSLLALHWVTAPHRGLPTATQTGFVRLDRPALGLSLPSLSGPGAIDLARLAGKPIVLNFWNSTCYPCTKETPTLANEARAMGSKVTFVGVDTFDRRGAAIAFVRRYQVPYQIAFDPSASAAAQYGVPALPVTFFLSASAKTIVGENIGALTESKLRFILRLLYGVT